MLITLNQTELDCLALQKESTASDGGFQGFMVKLQNQLNGVQLRLDADDLERIPRYAFEYSQGGWEDRLIRIFKRHLGADLKGEGGTGIS